MLIFICGIIIGAAVTLGAVRKAASSFISNPEKTREFIFGRINRESAVLSCLVSI